MLTIDSIDEHIIPTEKPKNFKQPAAHTDHAGPFEQLYMLAQSQHNELLAKAHSARLLKVSEAGNPAIEVQRFLDNAKTQALTLAERYIGRNRN